MNKNNKTWLWILGWILVFPIALSFLLRKNEKMSMALKLVIVTAAALLYVGIGRAAKTAWEERRDSASTEQVVEQEAGPSTEQTAGLTETVLDALQNAPDISNENVGNEPGEGETPSVHVNNDVPYFASDSCVLELQASYAEIAGMQSADDANNAGKNSVTAGDESAEASHRIRLSEMDSLGRCGVCAALLGPETLPETERGQIGDIRPSGWHTVKYDSIEDMYLYNRCHLLGYQLTGINGDKRNLITGTRYMNVQGMEPFETMTADYIAATGNHVLYRVTPLFAGDELVARGVLMEGLSLEDSGKGICFAIYCFNIQPGIKIDYLTGESEEAGENRANENTTGEKTTEENQSDENSTGEGTTGETATEATSQEAQSEERDYILNTNTHKFHRPTCSSVDDMKEKNKKPYHGTREEVIDMGYEPCKRCNP